MEETPLLVLFAHRVKVMSQEEMCERPTSLSLSLSGEWEMKVADSVGREESKQRSINEYLSLSPPLGKGNDGSSEGYYTLINQL